MNLLAWRTDRADYYWGHREAILRAKIRLACYTVAFAELGVIAFRQVIVEPGMESLVWIAPLLIAINLVPFLLVEAVKFSWQWGEDWWPAR